MNGEEWIKTLQTIDCEECHTLIQGWLSGDVPTREVCAHIHGCEISQARLRAAQAIPVEIPIPESVLA